ncbi:MAG: hypothetical protein WC917_03765, partial [Bacilli bacterium]
NTAFGTNIFLALSTGHHNSAFGVTALSLVTTGDNNTAIGALALQNNTTGDENTAVGFYSLLNNVAGLGSTAIGYRAMMYANSTATPTTTYNTAVGYEAMRGSTISVNNTGKYNTAVGYQSLDAMTSGGYNTVVGVSAGGKITTGSNNTLIGYNAGIDVTTQESITGVGFSALESNSGNWSTGIGYDVMHWNTGNYSNGVGHQALWGNIGDYSNGFGNNALLKNEADFSNGFGDGALYNNMGIGSNGFGHNVLYYNEGDSNIAFGHLAFNDFNLSTSAEKTFAYTDIDVNDYINIAGHGFGSAGSYVLLKYSEGTSPIGGMTNGTVYEFYIEDATKLYVMTTVITSHGTGTGHKLTPQHVYSNSIAIGYNAEPTGSNQIRLGNSAIEHTYIPLDSASATYGVYYDAVANELVYNITGIGGITSHSGLDNLDNDDHLQYALLNGRVGDTLLIDSIGSKRVSGNYAVNFIHPITVKTTNAVGGGDVVFYNDTIGQNDPGLMFKNIITGEEYGIMRHSGDHRLQLFGSKGIWWQDNNANQMNFDSLGLYPIYSPGLALGQLSYPWAKLYTTNITDDSTNIKFNVPVTTDDSVLTINGRIIGKKKLVIPDVSGYQLNADTSTTDATRKWVTDQGYLVAEVDGSVSNELQSLTYNRDTRILEISGGTEDTLNTVAVTNGATGLSNADQIYDFTIGLGYVPTNSTTTQLNYLSSATGTTGTNTTNIVYSTSPTLTTPNIGVATATSITYTDPTPYMNSFRTAPFWVNDFMTSSTQTYPWASTGVSSGTQRAIVGSVNHPGIVKVNSSSTANSGYYYEFINSSLAGLHGNEVTTAIIFPIRTDSVTTRFGFHDATSSSDAVDGVYFEVVPGDGECSGKTANNSVRSTTGTHYHLSNSTWYRLYLVVNGDATRVDYYIFDAAGAQLWTDGLTTNIPTARSTGHGIICTKTLGGVSELINIDYMDCYLGRLIR